MFNETLECYLKDRWFTIEVVAVDRDPFLVYVARIWEEGTLINADELKESINNEVAMEQGWSWLKEYVK